MKVADYLLDHQTAERRLNRLAQESDQGNSLSNNSIVYNVQCSRSASSFTHLSGYKCCGLDTLKRDMGGKPGVAQRSILGVLRLSYLGVLQDAQVKLSVIDWTDRLSRSYGMVAPVTGRWSRFP